LSIRAVPVYHLVRTDFTQYSFNLWIINKCSTGISPCRDSSNHFSQAILDKTLSLWTLPQFQSVGLRLLLVKIWKSRADCPNLQ